MEEKASYYDYIIEKNVCIPFQKTGYCSEMSACPYFHKLSVQKNCQKIQKNIKVQKVPLKKYDIPKWATSKESVEKSVQRFKKIKEMQEKQLFANRIKQQYNKARSKANLNNNNKKFRQLFYTQQLEEPIILSSNKKKNTILQCHHCKLSHPEENLFCNSFCGHLFCYFCITQQQQCSQCSIPFDKETSQIFFQWFCKGCEKQNSTSNIEKLCRECVVKQQKKMKKKKEQQQIIKKIKQNPMLCIICFISKKEFCVFPCAHMLYCETCIENVKKSQKCSYCNRGVQNIRKIFY